MTAATVMAGTPAMKENGNTVLCPQASDSVRRGGLVQKTSSMRNRISARVTLLTPSFAQCGGQVPRCYMVCCGIKSTGSRVVEQCLLARGYRLHQGHEQPKNR